MTPKEIADLLAEPFPADLGECSPLPDLRARGWEDPGVSLANARLIAAAPDLLAACERLIADASRFKAVKYEASTFALLNAAVVKAKGTP